MQVFTRATAEAAPCAVFDDARRPCVIAADTRARALGVHSGEALMAAHAIAPDVVFRARDTALEVATLDELAAACARFTPSLALAPPDTILLEVSASLRLFGGREALLQALADTLTGLGLIMRSGLAPTPLAAHWFALAATTAPVGPGWQDALDALPLEVLGIGTDVSAATLELLAELGLQRLAQVRRLPREGLARRQARAVLDALARARGEVPDPRRWHEPPARFASTLALPVATANTEPLLFAVSRLVAGLIAWLAARHAGIDRFTLELVHEDHSVTSFVIISGEPLRENSRLMLLTRERLSALTLPAPVDTLRLIADAPVLRPGRTPDLFGDPARNHENAVLLLDRLRARLGPQAVRRIAPWPDHRPERASRMLPVDAPAGDESTTCAPRPAWLLERPRPIGAAEGLEFVAGPERIESGWWDGADLQRDYFVVRAPDAALWWVFRDHSDDGWYLHGHFG